MNNGGDAADLMVRESIEITEAAVKLSALGAKNLAAIALALVRDNTKNKGKTNLDRLLKEGKELQVFYLKSSDLPEFKKQAKQYGVLFSAIRNKGEEILDVLCKANDVAKLNRIFERMGYPAPEKKEVGRKKEPTRPLPGKNSAERGISVPGANQTISSDRPSLKPALQKLQHAVRRIQKEAIPKEALKSELQERSEHEAR